MSGDNPRAIKNTGLITEYIALDDQSLLCDEIWALDVCVCVHSSHSMKSPAVLPKMRGDVNKHIYDLLQQVFAFNSTTDI